MVHKAKKIVIITEKIIAEGVIKIIEDNGGTGYTITAAEGKGSRNIRSRSRPVIIDALSNIKFEVITGDEKTAQKIADAVAETYFDDYSGITYMENVEILRPHKFIKVDD